MCKRQVQTFLCKIQREQDRVTHNEKVFQEVLVSQLVAALGYWCTAKQHWVSAALLGLLFVLMENSLKYLAFNLCQC